MRSVKVRFVTAAQAGGLTSSPAISRPPWPWVPDPDGEGDLSQPWSAAAMLIPVPAHRAGGARVHRLLLPHRTGRPLHRSGFRFCLDLHQMRPVMARGADSALHHRPGLLRPRTELALAVIAAENPGSRGLVAGHSAGGLIVSLWLDRLGRRGATAVLGWPD